MITIDGSQGEGGGQILRSSLALSILTGTAFRAINIRAGRPKPGLMRQHLAAVKAAAEISGAAVDGAELRGSSFTFSPSKIKLGDYHFAVGSAGSTTLVLQTILPPLMLASGSSTLILEGGTHNPHAPPFEFIARSFLPIINRLGPQVTATLERPGFAPAGGGRLAASIIPIAKLRELHLLDRGAIGNCYAEALIAGLDVDIAKRELVTVGKEMQWNEDKLHVRGLSADHGPGNALMITQEFEHMTEVTTGFGVLGVSGMTLARNAARRARGFASCNAVVGYHLADQLLLPMALAGRGAFTTVKPSNHTRTQVETIRQFGLGDIDLVQQDDGLWRVSLA
jgi:RNA 3'-terminal phosphate cyclase (ATP)